MELVEKLFKRLGIKANPKAMKATRVVINGHIVRVSVDRTVYSANKAEAYKYLGSIAQAADRKGLQTKWSKDHLMIWK